jgi:endo-1,4-beta-mannosidase
LNDLTDLTDYPLYDNPPHVLAQTTFIVQRYRDEAAILAWDLRNEGDIDYGTHESIPGHFSREVVLNWLAQTSALVHALDRQHLITAGWLYDNESTAPFVDFISFHYWVGAAGAQERIIALQAATDKPVLLQEFGYSTQHMDPDSQARTIREVIDVVHEASAAGWLIWTAFDFPTDATCIPPNCPSPDNAEHHFGLWTADYQPKPAVDVLAR